MMTPTSGLSIALPHCLGTKKIGGLEPCGDARINIVWRHQPGSVCATWTELLHPPDAGVHERPRRRELEIEGIAHDRDAAEIAHAPHEDHRLHRHEAVGADLGEDIA